jgi:hypothetical protein
MLIRLLGHAAAKVRRKVLVLVLPLTLALFAATALVGLQLAAGDTARASGGGDRAPATLGPAAVTAATGVCKIGKQAFAVHGYTATLSTSFVDVAGASVTFNVGGRGSTCLTVNYTAVAESSGTAGDVRAVLDGSTIGNPARSMLTYFDSWKSTAASFVITGVSPGTHTLTIQFASFGGQIVEITTGTLIVSYR